MSYREWTLSRAVTIIVVIASLLKEVYFKRKESTPNGSTLFPLRVGPFRFMFV